MLFFISLLASALEIIDPVVWGLKQYTFRKFRSRTIVTNVAENRQFCLLPITKNAVEVEALSKSKNRITGMVYFIVISLISFFRIASGQTLSIVQVDPVWSLAPLVVIFFVAPLTVQECWRFPRKVYIVDIYLLKIEGHIPIGNYFQRMETAINEDDWVTARYNARSGFMKKDFAPEPEEIY